MRICIVYDCLFPWTVGGAERWYRNVAERLAGEGHDVTYVTRRQWPRDKPPTLVGVRVVAVSRRTSLYTRGGRRRLLPPIQFGLGIGRYLLGRREPYDVVHTASFPFFSLLAIGAVRRHHTLVVDWHEVWTRRYWRDYLGPIGGCIGWRVQRRCVRVPHEAICFSRMHAARLRVEGFAGDDIHVLRGQFAGNSVPGSPQRAGDPLVVYAGRQVPEKRVPALVEALAVARRSLPGLRAELYGDGPDHERVRERVASLGLGERVRTPGFADHDVLVDALRRAACLVLPSSREGYGLVLVEAMSAGTPGVVVEGADSAATELIVEGINGTIAASADPDDLAAAILDVLNRGTRLRESTIEWYARNRAELSLDDSLDRIARLHADVAD